MTSSHTCCCCRWLLLLLSCFHVACLVRSHTVSATDAACCHPDWTAHSRLQLFNVTQSTTAIAASTLPFSIPAAPRVRLLVGVKTNVIHGAVVRRAIRSTWANRASLPVGVRIVFLGCAPDLTRFNATEVLRIRDVIAAEQQEFDSDLLVDDLVSCRDAYDDLVNKVLAFFQWSASQPAAHNAETDKSFVMVADDDIYVRMDRLLAILGDPVIPAYRFYGGQVWATQYRRATSPQRPLSTRYYLSRDHYAMDQLPPFANGPHYVISTDVAHFLGQHRSIFRGVGGDPHHHHSVGSLDDVSVALWLLAMQIHPQHFPHFINLRDTMCANNVVSFADLTPDALSRIHANVQRHRPVCESFSFTTWLKRVIPHRSDEDVRDDAHRVAVWNTLALRYRVERLSHVDDTGVFIEVTRNDPRAAVHFKFVPTTMTYYVFCEIAAHHIATTFSVLTGQRVFVCDQLRTTLSRSISEDLTHSPWKRPSVALLLHNLENKVVSPSLTIAVATDARYALVVIETLLAQAYADVELQVFDAATYREDDRDPDVVVFTTAETSNDAAAKAMVKRYVDKYNSRLVLLYPRELPLGETLDERVLVITSAPSSHSRQLYLPLAATAFGSSTDYSPVDLLQSFDSRRYRATPPHTSSPFRLRQFCIDDYARHQCVHPHRQYFYNLLNALDRVDVAGACSHHASLRGIRNNTLNESIHMTSAYYLDSKAARFKNYKFTIAFEDAVNVPGHITDTIVAAFLAGSVPIYYGHSPTITHLFNAKAFIDCGAFASLRICATHVLAVHASPTLYDAMRREAPVVNRTAFYEAFSWDPNVVEMLQQITNSNKDILTLGERFKWLLDHAP